MDSAQINRWNYNWNVSLVLIIVLFSADSITVLLRILTVLSLPKPTRVGHRRFTLAEWTMIAAFVRTLRAEPSWHYPMN